MTIEQLINSAKLFVEGKLSGEEFTPIFEEFYKMFFDYSKIKSQNLDLADLVEEINEDVSRFESNKALRLEQPNYYIDENKLRDSVKRLVG